MKTKYEIVNSDGTSYEGSWMDLIGKKFKVRHVELYFDYAPGGEDEMTFILESNE